MQLDYRQGIRVIINGVIYIISVPLTKYLSLTVTYYRDQPKQILLVMAVAKTVAETRDTYTAVTEPQAKRLGLVSAETIETKPKLRSKLVVVYLLQLG